MDTHEAIRRMATITGLEVKAAALSKEIYRQKADLLQDFYGFDIQKIDVQPWSYTDHTFTKGDQVFCDIDDAMEYAESTHG